MREEHDVNAPEAALHKCPTGIPGLDHVTRGGLPTGQATLVLGQAGAGKTVLCLQVMAAAIERGEGGVFVTFEESPAQVRRNATSFRWGAALLASERFRLIDARPPIGAEASGEFDIDGLMSVIAAAVERHGGPWVVIDGIDQLLQHQPNRMTAIDQVRSINDYCEKSGWTLLLSGKATSDSMAPAHLEGIEFLLPTTLLLSARMQEHRLNRALRIAKYRGSGHVVDELPMLMDDEGIQLPYHEAAHADAVSASDERIGTGIERLDGLLGGGILRGSSLLISGRPGTAKSTLAASFAEATARRGERTLYVSFDELERPYVRNLASVGIDLRGPIESGLIRFQSLSAYASLVTEHVLALRRLLDAFAPHCLVIDPISALLKASAAEGPRMATEHLLDMVRRRGITTVLTSLSGLQDPEGEATLGHVSTIADSWIVLDYNVRAGERNRSLSIVKSRGSAHSKQQRELLLSNAGIDLADVYEYGSEVLMGTARALKESEEAAAERSRQLERKQRRLELERRLEHTEHERRRLAAELELEAAEDAETDRLARVQGGRMKRLRMADREVPSRHEPGPEASGSDGEADR
ncbi:MAG: AAA family ATPase [Gammaproteobacteria bacterium]|nr:AAA family ATPase [Gammaproteobacteria bacterium]